MEVTMCDASGCLDAGKIYEVSEAKAAALIAHRYAVMLEDTREQPKIEVATQPQQIETASTRPKRR